MSTRKKNLTANRTRIKAANKKAEIQFKKRNIYNDTIEYINANTGSGKTAYIIDTVLNNPTEQYLIVTPSKELCTEIATRMEKVGISVDDISVVHQDTVDSPTDEVAVSLVDTPRRIIITTQMAFLHGFLKDIIRYKFEWNLIMDEDFKPIYEQELYLTKTSVGIFESAYLPIRSELNSELLDLMVHPDTGFNNEIADSLLKSPALDKLNDFVSCSAFFVTMTKGQYATYKKYRDIALANPTEDKGIKVHVTSFLKPEMLLHFKTVLVSSSCFDLSLSCRIFEIMNINLVQRDIDPKYATMVASSDADSKKIKKAPNVNITYFTEKNWSKTLKSTMVGNKTLEQVVYDHAVESFDGNEFIFNANKSFRGGCDDINGKLVTNIHGVNSHMDVKNVLYMPALNASADVIRVLNVLGISRKQVDFDRNVLSAYQFASRSAIRDSNNTDDINIFVPDKRTAEFLCAQYENSSMEYVSLIVPKKKVSNADKSFVCRVKKRLREGKTLRPETLVKFKNIIGEYYNGKC